VASFEYNAEDPALRVITIPAPITSVSLQTIYNDYRDWEDDMPTAGGITAGMVEIKGPLTGGGARPLMDAFLKEDLGTGETAVLFVRFSNTVVEFAETGQQCRITGGVLYGFDDLLSVPLEPIRYTANQQVVYDRAVTGLLLGQPDIMVDQAWVYDPAIPILRTTALLHQDGQFIALPTATVVFTIYDDTGAVIHLSGGIAPDANGMFHHNVTFVPATGRIYSSKAVITDGSDTYTGVELIAVAA
jgi:hypothetical protein